MQRCVVLLSGGLDSATTLAVAKRDMCETFALSVDYGQRHQAELDAAARVAKAANVSHKVVRVDLSAFGGSALTDDVEVPKDEDAGRSGIPITYVPARNTVLLSLGLAYAETLEATRIYCGVNAVDYSGYPDCRPEFIAAFSQMANLATKAAVEGRRLQIRTPLIDLTKADIVQLGTDLGVDYSLTVTCYDPTDAGLACGRCDACQLRRVGFLDADLPDPTRYA
jgi:7-cyano-7-deazaguanine synthase